MTKTKRKIHFKYSGADNTLAANSIACAKALL